jgi:multisubunit Na+/H+ antiporter MnhB subunit
VFPLLLLFSVFLLARGHNEPGAASRGGWWLPPAFSLVVIAYGTEAARKVFGPVPPP